MQHVALASYNSRPIQYLLRTAAGRAAFETAYLWYKHWIEAPGAGCLASYVQPGDWLIDVGANIGYFACKFAGWVGAGGKVLALEPEGNNFSRLQTRLTRARMLDRVIALRNAAAEIDGRLRLAVNPRHPGDHSLSESVGLPVEVRRLDSLWDEYGRPRVALLKVDVQGAELKVIRGAATLIEICHPVLLLEIDQAALAGFATTPAALLECVRGYGYTFHRISRSGISPLTETEILCAVAGPPATYCDVVALPHRQYVEQAAHPC